MTPLDVRLAVTLALCSYAPCNLSELATVAQCSREDALRALYELRDIGVARVVSRGDGTAASDRWA